MDVLVVKIGGSLARSGDLPRWIQALEESRTPLVIVPGGGPFADAVRNNQSPIGYDDAAAHRMAILAMEQFGYALVSRGRRLVAAASEEAIAQALAADRIPVWMPSAMLFDDPDLPQDWSVTSDSLAAWLARRLKAPRLLLVKQIDLPKDATIESLSRARMVDEAFVQMLPETVALSLAGPAALGSAGRRLAEGMVPGSVARRTSTASAEATP
ncbi:amino acid kinase [Mangrovicella endophytica]|uniref:amino acid kinase family protein n=1 Tax=Mangrovicella endophytica TaxID=2066697 RepID=UPI000C9E38F8|nr:amino acid kinase [Mangrovicella endophytica]